eukprot:GSChrysophyteH2.ASY1.ANO1.888.1 assembled CDS
MSAPVEKTSAETTTAAPASVAGTDAKAAAAAPAPAPAAKEAAAAKPTPTKLSATTKEFTYNPKVAEFKPSWLPAGGAAPAGAGAVPGGGPGQPKNYNAQAHEFVPGGVPGGFMPPMGPGGIPQQVMGPNGPMVFNPQINQYVPAVGMPPQMMPHGGHGGFMPPQGYAHPGQFQGGQHGHFKGPRGGPGGNNMSHHQGGKGQGGPGDKSSGPSPPLPEAGAIRFGTFEPKGEPKADAADKPADKPTTAAAVAAVAAVPVAPAGNKTAEAKKVDTDDKDAVPKTANRWGRSAVDSAAAPAPAAAAATDSKEGGGCAWGKEKLSVAADKAAAASSDGSSGGKASDGQFVRGQSVPSPSNGDRNNNSGNNGNNSPQGGAGGWKRGESMPVDNLLSKDDGHKRYDKQALLALFTKNKKVPDEIKITYPNHSLTERVPLLPKQGQGGNGRQQQGGNRSKNKQEDLEPHPDEAKIFDFANKDASNTFTFQKDRLADETDPDVIISKANLILNKLSVTKFEKLSDEFMKCGLHSTDELIEKAVEMVVLKAQMEEHFCFMYADLCKKITELWTEGGGIRDPEQESPIPAEEEPASLGKLFRQKLLSRCQEEFGVDRAAAVTAIKENADYSPEDKEEKEILLKKRYTGHMRFIGELYLKDMVTAKIMHGCVSELLGVTEEAELVCMCKLLVTIGYKLENYDKRKRHTNFDNYFLTIGKQMKEHPNSRMRFMLRDLIDQRRDGWVARREEERAMDMAEIPATDEWQTVATTKKGPISGARGGSSYKSSSGDARAQKSPSQQQGGNAFSALSSTSRSSPQASPGKASKTSWSATGTSSSSSAADKANKTSTKEADKSSSSNANKSSSNAASMEVPGADGIITKETRDKVRSILGEYYVNEDAAEALTTFKEVIHPNAMGEVVGQPKGCIDFVFEKYPGDVGKLCSLLSSLHAEKFLSCEQVDKAALLFLDNFDETIIDSPKASEYGAEIMATLVHSGLLSLNLFAEVPEESMWHMSFRRAGFFGHLLTALVARTSADSVKASIDALGDKLDVMSMVTAEPKQSEEEAKVAYLAKYDKLAFLKQ